MTLEETIANALAAQLDPMKRLVDRLTGEIAALRRSLPPQLLTPAEAAKVLRVSLSTVRRRIKDNTLPVDRSCGQPRIDASALGPLKSADIDRRAFEILQGQGETPDGQT